MWHIGIYILYTHTHTHIHTYTYIQLKHGSRVYIRSRVDESGWSMLRGGVLGGGGRVSWSGPSRKLFNSTRRDRFKWLVESLQDRLDFFTLHTFLPTHFTTAAADNGDDATAEFLTNVRLEEENVSRRQRRWSQRSLVCESNIVLTTFPLVNKQIVTHFFSFFIRVRAFIGRSCS